MAEPFVPVFSRERQGRWLAPFRLGAGAVVWPTTPGGSACSASRRSPVRRLSVDAEKLLDKPIIADPVRTEAVVIVVTAEPGDPSPPAT
ncbi:MAG: hypothetical protein U0790_03505 [Isosphaeraceae bacterium]